MTLPRLRLWTSPRLIIQIQVEAKDLWVGVFWDHTPLCFHVYACVIPMVPLHITYLKEPPNDKHD